MNIPGWKVLPDGHYDRLTKAIQAILSEGMYYGRAYVVSELKLALEEANFAPTPPAPEAEQDLTRLIDEQDRAEYWADKLANAISERFWIEIGEHSNLNSPWQNALEAIERPDFESEPIAWAAHDTEEGFNFISAFRDLVNEHINDAIADEICSLPYRLIPLYTHPANDKLRKAAGAEFTEHALIESIGLLASIQSSATKHEVFFNIGLVSGKLQAALNKVRA
ncbi:hypothetical protein [Nitrosospira sp. Nsp1]|uniref:hypothetical protein n=1 Tax=Nitrosospira sp. Nsp1 TaxID=136547 RepID=UPI000888A589|nr:hypothetical protein [Nitrosospira sp. Nsp1]SCX40594.1 hypothetical protein SAMN05720354_103137 [Nitrosospira sp. Nsp1]